MAYKQVIYFTLQKYKLQASEVQESSCSGTVALARQRLLENGILRLFWQYFCRLSSIIWFTMPCDWFACNNILYWKTCNLLTECAVINKHINNNLLICDWEFTLDFLNSHLSHALTSSEDTDSTSDKIRDKTYAVCQKIIINVLYWLS